MLASTGNRCLWSGVAHVILSAALVSFLSSSHIAHAARPEHVIRIYKGERRLVLEVEGEVVRSFRVGLGGAPAGDKLRQGDLKTPEGEFYVAWKNPSSSFHRFLGLSYPMPRHAERALGEGLISKRDFERVVQAAKAKDRPPQDTRLGGFVGIHGGGGDSDWTLGCIAVTDEEAEFLFERVRQGDRIVVEP
jgi:murein L,D-transpeptidase YafK